MNKHLLVAVLASAALSGCISNDVIRARVESNPAGAKGLLRGDELRGLSIANLVGSFVGSWTPVDVKDAEAEQRATDKAVAAFYLQYAGSPNGPLIRNEIQSRILAAANQRCHLWKNYLSTASSTVGFWSGLTSSATGAAAIAFSPTSTKDALTAVSTTSSSVGAQFDKSYLFSLTMPVVFQGVESRRTEISNRMRARRGDADGVEPVVLTSLSAYPLSQAIADVLEYHASCSVASGLQQAAEKLADARPPKPAETTPPPPSQTKDTATPVG